MVTVVDAVVDAVVVTVVAKVDVAVEVAVDVAVEVAVVEGSRETGVDSLVPVQSCAVLALISEIQIPLCVDGVKSWHGVEGVVEGVFEVVVPTYS